MLNDKEKSEIEKFCANETLKEAVRKVLLAGIYENGVLKEGQKADPSKNFALYEAFMSTNGAPITDAELGQVIRAKAWGIKAVEMAFAELDNIKLQVPAPVKNKTNKAL
jgi:hypothetical protein